MNYEIPKKNLIEKAIIEVLEKKKEINRTALIRETAMGLGLTAEDFKNSAPDSRLTAYKSIIGTIISDLTKLAKIDCIDNVYKIKSHTPTAKPKKADMRKIVKEDISFEKITFEATKIYKALINETDKLRMKYILELKKSLLECLAVCGSEFFEEVSVKLICLAYNVPFEYGAVIGGTDDGGIDGVVRIVDDLGFDKEIIYIQSKCRSKIDYYSTATEVREFWGAAGKKEAKKAVFMTNGRMHKDATGEAYGNKSLILVDGEKLAELMIKYNLGVKMINNLPVIDEAFFPIIK